MEKDSALKLVLLTNACILAIGTVVQATDHPLRQLVLGVLFIIWLAVFVFHVSRNGRVTAAE